MSLSVQLLPYFRAVIRARGEAYAGRVRILEGGPDVVRATVTGGAPYQVRLEVRDGVLRAWCACPYLQRESACKHLWATVLVAESRGYLGLAMSSRAPISFALDYDGEVEGDVVKVARASSWKEQLAPLLVERPRVEPSGVIRAGKQLMFIIDAQATLAGHGLMIELAWRGTKHDGQWSKPKVEELRYRDLAQLDDPLDRTLVAELTSVRGEELYTTYRAENLPRSFRLLSPRQEALIPRMCATGRCWLRAGGELRALAWDDGAAWRLELKVALEKKSDHYVLEALLLRDAEGPIQRMRLAETALLVAGGLVFYDGKVARLDDPGDCGLLAVLRTHGALRVPKAEGGELLAMLLRLPNLPRLRLPKALRYEERAMRPRPRIKITQKRQIYYEAVRLHARLSFDYDGEVVAADSPIRGVFKKTERIHLLRDHASEQSAASTLRALGFRDVSDYVTHESLFEIGPRHLSRVVDTLLKAGWRVEAEGQPYRQPGKMQIGISSGIDWFDLHGGVDFDGELVPLPRLLAAVARGESMIRLGDGSVGMLPSEWLKQFGVVAAFGSQQDDHVRFSRGQVGLLDALLLQQPEVTGDEIFKQARAALERFSQIDKADPTAGFVGTLREYQRDGLGWLLFLQRAGLGGCLADDMGLGKTVQVLALLEARRASPGRRRPSLLVMPRSILFNWMSEAKRFTPKLRLLNHTGAERAKTTAHFDDYDVVITTYGTLRRDMIALKDFAFDYVILDEAQAIKNAGSDSAKAVRLLKGAHRLALSGTPIENHVGELWSLFEFLNPGLLGRASLFRTAGAGARSPDEATQALLSRALRPYILRRTKADVAKDLPRKLEQTLYCELESEQRKRYDELRLHYRQVLSGRIEKEGLAKSKMHVLEALLRLRQAACHPGLIDKAKRDDASAKLEVLLPQLTEVIANGHKALVFSQFVNLLAIVRDRLDKLGVSYEYLDGKTRDRQRRVERFQGDPDCKLFLISIKAGGLGLNLTAAEYVFLLDPWWNPAVEAQAIDRSHRIGQTRPVFAYRLIARDTVEDKVLELQHKKRKLADAIIQADRGLLSNLKKEDVELLLS